MRISNEINIAVILLAAALCFLLAGCGREKSPMQSDSVQDSDVENEQMMALPPETQEYSSNAEVSACYPEDWWYNSYPEYEEIVLDSTEYAVPVAVETTKSVTDFKVVSLDITDYSEDGLVCSTTELFSLPELTPDKPLLITLSFPGDIPSYGVQFFDVFGSQRLFTFCQSGMDGSLIFEEAMLDND